MVLLDYYNQLGYFGVEIQKAFYTAEYLAFIKNFADHELIRTRNTWSLMMNFEGGGKATHPSPPFSRSQFSGVSDSRQRAAQPSRGQQRELNSFGTWWT